MQGRGNWGGGASSDLEVVWRALPAPNFGVDWQCRSHFYFCLSLQVNLEPFKKYWSKFEEVSALGRGYQKIETQRD